MAQPKSRVPMAIGLTAAAGVGYYLYQSGGNPKLAEKKMETDVARASAKLKGEMPGHTKEAEKKASEAGTEIGQKIDNAADRARAELNRVEKTAEQYRQEAAKETMAKVDKFDAVVEKKAAEAKSGISGWFGGK